MVRREVLILVFPGSSPGSSVASGKLIGKTKALRTPHSGFESQSDDHCMYSQAVWQRPLKPYIDGSNPSTCTKIKMKRRIRQCENNENADVKVTDI